MSHLGRAERRGGLSVEHLRQIAALLLGDLRPGGGAGGRAGGGGG